MTLHRTQHRTLARWSAALMVAGTVLVGVVAPAQAATAGSTSHSSGLVRPGDTGWNGT